MQNIKDKIIGEMVAENYKYADIFKKYGIDFCCGGGITVEQACLKYKTTYDDLLSDLKNVELNNNEVEDPIHWKLDRLIDHIVTQHHQYVKEHLPLIIEYVKKVAAVHGTDHPETLSIRDLVLELEMELMPHMHKEEVILFPYIRRIAQYKAGENILDYSSFGSVENPIRSMFKEHDLAGDLLKRISELSNVYTLPFGACATYTVLYNKLQAFEEDLIRHIHLENNILFPRAIKMESTILLNVSEHTNKS